MHACMYCTYVLCTCVHECVCVWLAGKEWCICVLHNCLCVLLLWCCVWCAVYQTYVGAMNESIRRQIAISNPFVFKHISNLKVERNPLTYSPSSLPPSLPPSLPLSLLHSFPPSLPPSLTHSLTHSLTSSLPPSLPPTQSIDLFEDVGPCVIMASPGMMQSGLSRQLFEAWCTDKRNGVIVAGYCVEGTLAKVSIEQL